MQAIKTYFPHYKELSIHESSPGNRGVSPKLLKECKNYSSSHFYPDVPLGEKTSRNHLPCQDLERMTFESDSFDLFITQDVMEHIFNPVQAFQEIHRVLKEGGAHIFTVPLLNKEKDSECWASKDSDGKICYHHEPEYHGNPINKKGSLVTMHWGYDLAEFIQRHSGMTTTILLIDNIDLGIRAELIEVMISRKPKSRTEETV